MSMGKSSRGLLAKLASAAQATSPMMDKQPDQPSEMTIRESGNGGFIVRMTGKAGYSSQKEHVYETLDKVMACAEKHFGTAEKAEA